MRTGSIAMVGVVAAPAVGGVLASQDFEGNSLTTQRVYTDGSTFGTDAGTFSDSGSGLGWTTSWTQTLSFAGPSTGNSTTGDVIGVADNSFSRNDLSGAGNASNYFLADDVDGTLMLSFDTVDATGAAGLALVFDWAAADDGYEAGDFFRVRVNGDVVFEVAGNDLDGDSSNGALPAPSFSGQFVTESVDLSAYDGQMLDIDIEFKSNAAGEDFGFDNLFVTAVPLPGGGLLAGVGLAAVVSRRTRR